MTGFWVSMDMLKRLWDRWKRIAHKIGDFQARLILGVFYFVLLAPFALVLKLFSDPLHLKNRNAKWVPYPGMPDDDPLARARSQF